MLKSPIPPTIKEIEAIANKKVVVLSTVSDPISGKADWLIAGQTPAEKHGSFTNSDSIVQSFRRAIRNEQNNNDLDLQPPYLVFG